jgi:threonine dehydrogenase-like Zn-dependent dehydrogenase
MKALVYTAVETLGYMDVPAAVAGPGQSLVRIMASGICGSDMHAFLGHDERRPAPLILGHEAAGIVVGGPGDGRRVTINPLVTCGSCDACGAGRDNLCPERLIISMPPREGAFAQYVAMRDENLVTVPDHVPLEHAALAEPLACGWHAVRLAQKALDRPMSGVRCLVIGGGAIGLGAALSAHAFGARDITVVEPNDLRRATLDRIKGFVAAKTPTGQFDLVIDAVGYAATRADASALARPGGVIAHIGLGEAAGGLDIRRMTLQEITFFGTYTYTAEDFRATAQAIFDGAFGPLDWISTRPLSEGQQAFHDIRGGKVAAPKIILIPDHEE